MSAKTCLFLHCNLSHCTWLMKFVRPLWPMTLCSFYFSSHLGSRKFPVYKIPADIDLLSSHGTDFSLPRCLCSALQMHPEIDAAALAPDRQLQDLLPTALVLVFLPVVSAVALPRDDGSVSRVLYVGNCSGE